MGWCFFVENSVETFKDVGHLWKKKILYKIFSCCQRKKNKPFFLKGLCQILCSKNKKNPSENFLFKKKVLPLLFYEKKKKNEALCRTLWLKWQNSAHLKIANCQKQNRDQLLLEQKQARLCFVFFRVVFSSKYPK